MIKVLVVDDSPECRELLTQILSAEAGLQIAATTGDARQAQELVARYKPHVVVMDAEMPQCNGFEAARGIMETHPVPVIILSAQQARFTSDCEHAALVGAVATVPKPGSPTHIEYSRRCRQLIRTIKVMSEVKMVKRWTPQRRQEAMQSSVAANAVAVNAVAVNAATVNEQESNAPQRAETAAKPLSGIRFVVIGASTGGPPALKTVLAEIPVSFPAAILIVQHIATGFVDGLRTWLEETTERPMHIAAHGDLPLSGHVYLAPDEHHMALDVQGRIVLSSEPPENGLRPAVSYLFRSAAHLHAKTSVGVLLTGMGKDGAKELGQMRAAGSVTIAQDEKTSIVHGMPGEAIRLDAVTHVVELEQVAPLIIKLVKSL